MCWSFSSDWNGERLLILVNRNQSYGNNDTSDRAAVQCIRRTLRKTHNAVSVICQSNPWDTSQSSLQSPTSYLINSVFLPSLLCYYVIITTIKLVLWHCVILWRIHNTVIWLENVKIDKNCNYEVWWLQRRRCSFAAVARA